MVYFMNAGDLDDWEWNCGGEPLNSSTVMAWARVWNIAPYPEIPLFKETQIAAKADIRVKFSGTIYLMISYSLYR